MKIKADENIGRSAVELLRQGGHDVMTVADEGLAGASDTILFQASVSEDRTLVTLDRDLGHVPRFVPWSMAGIVILEPGTPITLLKLHARLRDFLALAAQRTVKGELLIVEPGRVRVKSDKDGA